MIQPTLINIHPNEYSQELHYYPSAAKLDKSVGSCNTLNDLPSKVCVPIKTEDSYIYMCLKWLHEKMNQNFSKRYVMQM